MDRDTRASLRGKSGSRSTVYARQKMKFKKIKEKFDFVAKEKDEKQQGSL